MKTLLGAIGILLIFFAIFTFAFGILPLFELEPKAEATIVLISCVPAGLGITWIAYKMDKNIKNKNNNNQQ